MNRQSVLERKTNETKINLQLIVDGTGMSNIYTDIGFFDHMLTLVSKHGMLDLFINVEGDVDVDCHHTIEDVGIVLGDAISDALGDKESIKRYGSAIIPMDDVLVMCALDLSGRPYLNFDASFTKDMLGTMDSEMVEEFFRALSVHGGMNIHIKVMYGKNNHHIAEAIFKAFGRAFDEASSIDLRVEGVPSSKGILE